MKNLFAAASYSFNNFYNNLNTQGQIVFTTILFLIGILCIVLLMTYIVQGIKYKVYLKKLKKKPTYNEEKKAIITNDKNINDVLFDRDFEKTEVLESVEDDLGKTEIDDIAKRVEEALKDERPINLTNFEEDQEKMAIISIDELMKRAKDLEIIEDEDSNGINYLEKYNLEPAEVEEVVNNTIKKEAKQEVKAFKVSQVISPIYGVKKEVIDNSNN